MMDAEQWRQIEGTRYEVSDLGRVRRQGSDTVLRQNKRPTGYLYTIIRSKWCPVHRLVAEAFLGPRPEGHDIHHRNGRKDDPQASNLIYVPAPDHNSYHKMKPRPACPVCGERVPPDHEVCCSEACRLAIHTVVVQCEVCGAEKRIRRAEYDRRTKMSERYDGFHFFCGRPHYFEWRRMKDRNRVPLREAAI